MQKVSDLRNKGFVVSPASDAVGCTSVVWDQPFYYFNPRFADAPVRMYEDATLAELNAQGNYRLLLAGTCPEAHENLPYAILTAAVYRQIAEQSQKLRSAQVAVANAQEMLRQAEAAYFSEKQEFNAKVPEILKQ